MRLSTHQGTGRRSTGRPSGKSGLAKYQDSNIGDAWDMAELPNGGFAVANAWTGVLTFYSRDGRTMRSPVTVPAAAIFGPGAVGSPTGLALNPTFNYVISKNGKSAPAS